MDAKIAAMPCEAKPRIIPLEKRAVAVARYINLHKFTYLLILPGLIYFLIFHYSPLYFLQVAFKDYNIFKGLSASNWVGFKNFQNLFSTKFFMQAFSNTVILSFMNKLFGFPAPIILALLLNEVRLPKLKKLVQTVVYLPHFLSWVIVGSIFITMLSAQGGLVNELLGMIGIGPISFMTSKAWFRWVLVFTEIWKSCGWGTIIYLASISGISPELYEAAVVDGAGRLGKIWHITLPCIIPTIIVVFVLSLAKVLNLFDQVFVMYNPLVSSVSETIDTYVYQIGIVRADVAFATTVGLFKNVITVALILLTNQAVKKIQGETVI
ncbi:MAG: ABC transporter permease subunit [Clostridiales bacterium]|jgi:putative aldouronate transport system permease protein|nr:ABC transporter permease subunit [Clostridiales bacterium]